MDEPVKEKSPELEQLCEARKVLAKAEELLTERTWCKGALFKEDGQKFCAIGALHRAGLHRAGGAHTQFDMGPITKNDHNPGFNYAQSQLHQAAWEALPPRAQRQIGGETYSNGGLSPVPFFNDHIAQNVQDVKKVFKAAIKKVEEKIEEVGNAEEEERS